MASTSIDNKIIDILVKGSFHQGDLSIFSADSVGRQCIANCVAAVSFAKLVPLYKWSSNNIDSILKCGDSIYKTVKTNHDFLHVSDVGSKISAFHQILTFLQMQNTMVQLRKNLLILFTQHLKNPHVQ